MSDKQMIEEMVLAVYPWLKEVPIEERKQLSENVSGLMVMERLYNAGYRKIPENAVVLTDKNDIQQYEWSKLVDKMGVIEFGEKVRKETAEKFAERLKCLFDEYGKYAGYHIHEIIDEICEEITEGKRRNTNETV